MEELYEKLIFQLLHSVEKCTDNEEVQLENVYSYLQNALKISAEKHEEFLEKAKTKEAPELILNVKLIEGTDMNPKSGYPKGIWKF